MARIRTRLRRATVPASVPVPTEESRDTTEAVSQTVLGAAAGSLPLGQVAKQAPRKLGVLGSLTRGAGRALPAARFLGPIGAGVGAVTLGYDLFRLLTGRTFDERLFEETVAREQQGLAVEQLGDQSRLVRDQIALARGREARDIGRQAPYDDLERRELVRALIESNLDQVQSVAVPSGPGQAERAALADLARFLET